MSSEIVSLTYEDGIAVIAIDNPPVNIINAEVRAGLSLALRQLRSLDRLGAVVLLARVFPNAVLGMIAPERGIDVSQANLHRPVQEGLSRVDRRIGPK